MLAISQDIWKQSPHNTTYFLGFKLHLPHFCEVWVKILRLKLKIENITHEAQLFRVNKKNHKVKKKVPTGPELSSRSQVEPS